MRCTPFLGAVSIAAVLALAGPAASAEAMNCQIDFGQILPRPDAGEPFHAPPAGPSAHLGGHGQLVFGTDAVYLHHLPFFLTGGRHPHNFQVLMRVSFASDADRQAYLDHRAGNPDALYTALPPDFTQDEIEAIFRSGDKGHSLGVVEFFDEHFENRPMPTAFLEAEVTVDEVVIFRELAPHGPVADELVYRIVQGGDETFLVHANSSPPDFDHVAAARVALPADGPADANLHGGVLRVSGASNDEAGRLRAGDTLACSAHDGTRRMPFDVTVSVGADVYCEAGELSAVAGEPGFEGKRACSVD